MTRQRQNITRPSRAGHRCPRAALTALSGLLLFLYGCRQPAPPAETHFWEDAPYEFAIGAGLSEDPLNWAHAAERFPEPTISGAHVTDAAAAFVADPFLWPAGDGWYLFYEILDAAARRGVIGLSWSADGSAWEYRGVVLREPFHLSFPLVFEWQGAHYMLPESYQAGAVQLYRADAFPYDWQPVARLLEGEYVDNALFRFEERWWMLSATRDNRRLHLFYSEHLKTGWLEHAQSPVIANDATRARAGGRVLEHAGRLYRVAQNCGPRYGYSTRVFEITTLTPAAYEEREIDTGPVLQAGLVPWSAWGMHHLDFWPLPEEGAGWMAAFDGYGPAQPDTALAVQFSPGGALGGITVRPRSVEAGAALLLRLYWNEAPSGEAVSFIHFEHQGRIIFQGDHHPAGRGAYDLVIPVPADAPAGVYRIYTGLADASGLRSAIHAAYPVRRRRVLLPVTLDLRPAPETPEP